MHHCDSDITHHLMSNLENMSPKTTYNSLDLLKLVIVQDWWFAHEQLFLYANNRTFHLNHILHVPFILNISFLLVIVILNFIPHLSCGRSQIKNFESHYRVIIVMVSHQVYPVNLMHSQPLPSALYHFQHDINVLVMLLGHAPMSTTRQSLAQESSSPSPFTKIIINFMFRVLLVNVIDYHLPL